jgi:putative endonuclease
MTQRQLGTFGEQKAVQHLRASGYTVCETNWRCARGEIDVVATIDDVLVIVEVRTRSMPLRYGTPEQSMTAKKIRTLRMLAQHYMCEKCRFDDEMPFVRFDCIAIVVERDCSVVQLQHIQNIA